MSTQTQPPRIMPPHYFLAAICLVTLSHALLPLTVVLPVVRWTGLLLIVPGVLLAVLGANLFRDAGTSIVPLTRSSTLVTTGVFRLSRNPMYLGMLLTGTGLLCALPSLPGLGVLVTFFLVLRQQFVLREERLLAATFGPAYADYQASVRRWL